MLGWLGVIAILVVAGLAGRVIPRPSPTPGPSVSEGILTPAAIVIDAPRPGSQWTSDGWLQLTGRTTSRSAPHEVVLSMSDVELGRATINPGPDGALEARYPLLPPITGGHVTLTVEDRSGQAGRASVDFDLMPAQRVLLWTPRSFGNYVEDTLAIDGAAQPSIEQVEFTVRRPDGTVIAAGAAIPGDEPPALATSVTRDWRSLRLDLALPTDLEPGCATLEARGIWSAGTFTMAIGFGLHGSEPEMRCFPF